MTPGGRGFFLLSYRGQRLALLSQDNTRSYTSPPPGVLDLRFYEIENEPLWRDLIQQWSHTLGRRPLIGCLQQALDVGDLTLRRHLRGPTGLVRASSYDLTGVQLKELVDDPEQVRIGPAQIGKTLRLAPCPSITVMSYSPLNPISVSAPPAPVTPPVGGVIPNVSVSYGSGGGGGGWSSVSPSPAPSAAPPTEGIELEVGRYALRSFDLGQDTLGSLFKRGHSWENGVAIAKCLADNLCAEPPTQDCRCGLYGTLTLDQLYTEYANRARYAVAVFAAEGRTFLGTKGLRTAAARVVAYWCEGPRQKKVLSACAPQATHFEDITEMLAAYKFPEYTGSPFPRYYPRTSEEIRHFALEVRASIKREVKANGWAQVAADWTARRQGKSSDLASLLSAATPGGLAALHELGVLSGDCSPASAVLRCSKCRDLVSSCTCAP